MADSIQNIIIPESNSLSNQWIGFHKNLKQKFGKQNANNIFLYVWAKNKNNDILTNNDFLDYLNKQGIKSDELQSSIDKIISSVSNMGSDFIGMTSKFSKIIKYGIPLMALSLIGFSIYKVIKK